MFHGRRLDVSYVPRPPSGRFQRPSLSELIVETMVRVLREYASEEESLRGATATLLQLTFKSSTGAQASYSSAELDMYIRRTRFGRRKLGRSLRD